MSLPRGVQETATTPCCKKAVLVDTLLLRRKKKAPFPSKKPSPSHAVRCHGTWDGIFQGFAGTASLENETPGGNHHKTRSKIPDTSNTCTEQICWPLRQIYGTGSHAEAQLFELHPVPVSAPFQPGELAGAAVPEKPL